MIKIELENGHVLEGIENIPISIFNSIFDQEVIRGEFSIGGTLSLSPSNRKALGYADQQEVVITETVKLDCNVHCGGYVRDARLILIDADEKGIRYTILFGWSKLAESLSAKTLRNLNFETIPLVYDSNVHESPSIDVADYETYQTALNEFAMEKGIFPEARDAVNICFPFLGLYKKDGEDEVVTEYNKMLLNVSTLEEEKRFHPAVFIQYILKQILEENELQAEGSFFSCAEFLDAILISGSPLKPLFELSFMTFGQAVAYPAELDLNTFLPEISVVDFLKALKANFILPLWVDFVNGKLKAGSWDEIFDSTDVLDWTDKVDSRTNVNLEFDNGIEETFFGFSDDNEYEKTRFSLADYPTRRFDENAASLAVNYPDPGNDEVGFLNDKGQWWIPAKPKLPPAYDTWRYLGDNNLPEQSGGKKFKANTISPTYDLIRLVAALGGPYGPKIPEKENFCQISYWMGKTFFKDSALKEMRVASSPGKANIWPLDSSPDPEKTYVEPGYSKAHSLWLKSDQGNPHEAWRSQPSMVAGRGVRFLDFWARTKQTRFKLRLSEADILDLKPVQKIRIGRSIYLFDEIRGSFPITETTEVTFYWIPEDI
jgi:hypothetical protein